MSNYLRTFAHEYYDKDGSERQEEGRREDVCLGEEDKERGSSGNSLGACSSVQSHSNALKMELRFAVRLSGQKRFRIEVVAAGSIATRR